MAGIVPIDARPQQLGGFLPGGAASALDPCAERNQDQTEDKSAREDQKEDDSDVRIGVHPEQIGDNTTRNTTALIVDSTMPATDSGLRIKRTLRTIPGSGDGDNVVYLFRGPLLLLERHQVRDERIHIVFCQV